MIPREPRSEQDLQAHARAGDRASFVALVERHLGALHRLAALLLPEARQMQLLQDAAGLVWMGASQLPAWASFREELLVVTAQLAFQRQPAATRSLRIAPPPRRAVSPATHAEVLLGLPPGDRLAHLLLDVEGLDDEQVARVLAEPAADVRRRAHVARLWLAQARR